MKNIRIFISYAEEDLQIAESIFNYFENFHASPFLARKNIAPGIHWPSAINANIEKCDWLVVLWSENSIHSDYLNYELSYASVLKKSILPIIINQTQRHPKYKEIQSAYWDPLKQDTSLNRISGALGLIQTEQPDNENKDIEYTIESATNTYNDSFAKHYSRLKVLGGVDEVDLFDAYLPLQVHQNDTANEDNVQLLADELMKKMGGKTLILGHPGMGKSTFLKFIALNGTSDLIPSHFQGFFPSQFQGLSFSH